MIVDIVKRSISTAKDSRTKEQWKIVQAWREHKGLGFVVAATGFGKSRIAENIIYVAEINQRIWNVAIGVPTLNLKSQWEKNIEALRLKNITVRVYVYNTLCTLDLNVDLLILDECHRVPAETFSQVFEKTKYKFLLGLTATFSRIDGRDSLIAEKAPIIATITMARARQRGWVSDFKEYAVAVPLTELEQRTWTALDEAYKSHAKHFGMSFGLAMGCLRDASTRADHARTRGWEPWMGDNDYRSPKMQFIFAKQLINKIQEQKRFISKHTGKETAAREIIMKLKKKTLVFGEVISVAQNIAARLKSFKWKAEAYHSKMNKRLREQVLADALEGKVDVICSAKALNEGFDFPAAELGISVSRNKSKTVYTQQLGRVVRKHGKKESMFLHLYLPGTKDQTYLTQATANSVGIRWMTLKEFYEAIGQID